MLQRVLLCRHAHKEIRDGVRGSGVAIRLWRMRPAQVKTRLLASFINEMSLRD